jgi:hypothetical protein
MPSNGGLKPDNNPFERGDDVEINLGLASFDRNG